MGNKYKKIEYVSFLQSLGIFLVLLGHSLNFFPEIMPLWAKIGEKFVYSFHMPLFFMLSGFLFSYSLQRNSKINFNTFIKNKILRLIVPYLSIGLTIYLLKYFIFNKFVINKMILSWDYYISTNFLYPTHNPASCLWFLPTLLAIFIIVFGVVNKISINKLLIYTFLIANISYVIYIPLFNLSGILYYIFFFILGIFIFKNSEILNKILSNSTIWLYLAAFFLLFLFISTIKFVIFNRLIMIITATLGILLSYSLALYCSNQNIKFMYGILDGYYFQIYLLAWFGQCGMRTLYQMNITNYVITVLLMIIAGILIPIIITKFIAKYLPKLKCFIGLK